MAMLKTAGLLMVAVGLLLYEHGIASNDQYTVRAGRQKEAIALLL
jgi:hypothetical protein